MGKYFAMFLVGFLVVAAIILGLYFLFQVGIGHGAFTPSWALAIILGLIGGACAFAVSVRKDCV